MQAAWDQDSSSFSFTVVLRCAREDLISFEQLLIDEFCPDLNISPTAGNCLGVKRSDESRERMRVSRTGRKLPWEQVEAIRKSLFGRPVSEETRAKIALQKGWKHSEEAKAKMRGRVVSEETRAKMRDRPRSAGHTTPHSEETKRRISEANKGRVLSEETRARMREAHARRKATRLS